MSLRTRPGPMDSNCSGSPTRTRCAPSASAATAASDRTRSGMELSSITNPSASSGSSGPCVKTSSPWQPKVECKVATDNPCLATRACKTLAALPVGVAKTISFPGSIFALRHQRFAGDEQFRNALGEPGFSTKDLRPVSAPLFIEHNKTVADGLLHCHGWVNPRIELHDPAV